MPKGLAAAVLASVSLQQGISGGEFIQNVTYTIILFSIIMTSALVFFLDKTSLSEVYFRFRLHVIRWIGMVIGDKILRA